MEIIPDVVSAADLEKRLGGPFVCPLCRAQSTADADDVGWVHMPEFKREPKWICLGSWIDVSSIARAEAPIRHPYYDDLVRLANLAGTSVRALTQSLLNRQLAILEANPQTALDPELSDLRSRIESLTGNVHR